MPAPKEIVAQRLVVGLIALISTMLGAYFIWLGTEVNAIGKRVERLDVKLESLIEDRQRRD